MSKSSVSRHIVEATSAKLKEFKERRFDGVDLFAVFIDIIHCGGAAFVVGLGIDTEGNKLPLGFWEGATENSDICAELFKDLTTRGLILRESIIFVTDGGSGVCKYLKVRFGSKLIHQRCTAHKARDIQHHLAKKCRDEAGQWFRRAMNRMSQEDAEGERKEVALSYFPGPIQDPEDISRAYISRMCLIVDEEQDFIVSHRLLEPSADGNFGLLDTRRCLSTALLSHNGGLAYIKSRGDFCRADAIIHRTNDCLLK